MTRRNFSRAVRVQIIKRACARNFLGQPTCERCGAVGGILEVHHKVMDAMEVDKTGPLTAEDGELLCRACHGPETAEQRVTLAKVLAMEESHLGASLAPAKRIQSRGFPEKSNISKITGKPKIEKLPMPARRR